MIKQLYISECKFHYRLEQPIEFDVGMIYLTCHTPLAVPDFLGISLTKVGII